MDITHDSWTKKGLIIIIIIIILFFNLRMTEGESLLHLKVTEGEIVFTVLFNMIIMGNLVLV